MPIPDFINQCDVETSLGEAGFLVEVCPQGKASRWLLRTRPQVTNDSQEPRLVGWCGETDNVSRFARGLARATVFTPNGRARIYPVVGEDCKTALELLAYPELLPA